MCSVIALILVSHSGLALVTPSISLGSLLWVRGSSLAKEQTHTPSEMNKTVKAKYIECACTMSPGNWQAANQICEAKSYAAYSNVHGEECWDGGGGF
jgi:hypothetical protein